MERGLEVQKLRCENIELTRQLAVITSALQQSVAELKASHTSSVDQASIQKNAYEAVEKELHDRKAEIETLTQHTVMNERQHYLARHEWVESQKGVKKELQQSKELTQALQNEVVY